MSTEVQDVQGQSSGPATQEQGVEGQVQGAIQDAADSGEAVPWHKDPRFKQFMAEKKSFETYKELGSPDDIKNAMGRLREYDRLVAEMEADRGGPKTDEQKELEKWTAQMREQLLMLVPEVKEIAKLKEAHDRQVSSKEKRAMNEMEKLMDETGMETDKKSLLQMSNVLADLIKEDAELLDEYWENPREAVRQAWDKIKKKFGAATERKMKAELQATKEPLTKLPKTHGPGGSTGEKAGQGPAKNLSEATARVRARLEAMKD